MEPSKTITLVRHGSTEFNEKGLWQGHGDNPLSEKGRNEAQQLAQLLDNQTFDAVFHSPLKRTLETAAIITNGAPNLPFETIDEFIEINLGDLEGKKHTDILKKYPEIHRNWVMDMEAPVPGGESFIDVYRRVGPGVEKILNSSFNEILIVAHGMVNRAILGVIMKMDPLPARKFQVDNCAVSRFLVYDTPYGPHTILSTWNNTSHLEENEG